MRVTCLIDSLASGGAQRQMCMLAVLLKRHGIDVSVLTYHAYDFFRTKLDEAEIRCQCLPYGSRFQRIFGLRRALRDGSQDVVLAFLDACSLYAELAGLPG